MGRRPDITFVVKEDNKIYELMYSERSRIFCSKQKENDDRIKLWHIQVAGKKLRLNVLIRDALKNNINDQKARTQIYDEMEPYLPGVKREYLPQIQNIINRFSKKSTNSKFEVSISAESKKISGTESSIPPSNALPKLFPFKKMLSKEEQDEHQSDSYSLFGSRCPICRENHMSLQEPEISIDEVLEAYPENSEPIQELKTQCFTLPIPCNNMLLNFPDKNIAVEA
nr:15552_t:CDS:2 [Entrophospora candida]